MGPKLRKVTRFAAGTLAALALSTGAEAAVFFVSYGVGAGGVTALSAVSDTIDVSAFNSVGFSYESNLGLTVTSNLPTTVSPGGAQLGLQDVQGCKIGDDCSAASLSWVPLVGLGVGGVLHTPPPNLQQSVFGTGSVAIAPGAGYAALRLTFDTAISPAASVGAAGDLTVTAVPEPGTWAMMLAGIIGVAGIARRRLG
jgi:hypothetical protein